MRQLLDFITRENALLAPLARLIISPEETATTKCTENESEIMWSERIILCTLLP